MFQKKIIAFLKLVLGIFIICVAAGIVSSKVISLKISQKIAEKHELEKKKKTTLFFYNSIGATPAFSTHKELSFTENEKYTIEVGYTKTRRGAEKIIDKLNLYGFPVFMTPVQLKNSKVAYKIRMGLFVTKDKAKDAGNLLAERTKYKGKIKILN